MKVLFFQFIVILIYLINFSLTKYINETSFNEEINFTKKLVSFKYWTKEQKEKLKDINFSNDNVEISSLVPSADFNFYNQLSDNEKIIYDALYDNSVKSPPNFEFKVEITLSKDESIENILSRVNFMFSKENVEFWWYESFSCNIQIVNGVDVYITFYLSNENSNFYGIDVVELDNEIEEVKNTIMNKIEELGLTTPYAIMRYIHDYLVINNVYTLDEDMIHIRNIYGSLVENKCVCEGYAEAFQYLVRQYNINCIIANSLSHEWNFVEIDNKWYVVDVTFDDPSIIGQPETPSGSSDNLITDYFLTGTEHVNLMNQKYSDQSEHILIYGYDKVNTFSYPEIETSDYSPNEKELEELDILKNYLYSLKDCNF